jgi:hypothetical protein
MSGKWLPKNAYLRWMMRKREGLRTKIFKSRFHLCTIFVDSIMNLQQRGFKLGTTMIVMTVKHWYQKWRGSQGIFLDIWYLKEFPENIFLGWILSYSVVWRKVHIYFIASFSSTRTWHIFVGIQNIKHCKEAWSRWMKSMISVILVYAQYYFP